MKIAFLILVHQNPDQILVLLDSISSPHSHAFIHIDRKSNRRPFVNALKARQDCTLLSVGDSSVIHWCGFGMPRATLSLLRKAVADHRLFDRFQLLSGADTPIKTDAELNSRLAGDEEIMRVDRMLDSDGDQHFDRCANRVFLGNVGLLNPRSRVQVLARLARKLESRLKRKTPVGLNVYYGPSWWCITRPAAEEILSFAAREPEIIRWFSASRSADEMLFQTIMKAGPLASKIAYDATRGDQLEPTLHGSHYVDWSSPNPSLPRTLEEKDLEQMLGSEALFARKIDPLRSKTLVDRIARLRGASLRVPFLGFKLV